MTFHQGKLYVVDGQDQRGAVFTIDVNLAEPNWDRWMAVGNSGDPGYVGASGGWVQVAIPVPQNLRTATFTARFVYGTGVSWQTTNQNVSMQHSAPGWYVDDVAVVIP